LAPHFPGLVNGFQGVARLSPPASTSQ